MNNREEINFVDITNAKIAYKSYGSGFPLIMCTGYATNMDLWSTRVIEILQQEYRVIVFDHRGMGLSTNADSSMSITSMAEDLNELLIALKIDKAHILGWSMGGFVAQMFAINHPGKVKKLVLYATNCGDAKNINPAQEIIDILANPAATPLELLGTLFPDNWLATHPEPWIYMPEPKEPYNSDTIGLQYVAVQNWLSPGGGSTKHLHKLNVPVLLICGDQDKVVPWKNSSILKESIPYSTLIMIPDSGHGLMYQLPEIFANHVSFFLQE
ncbi:MAG: alpha/beta hydrolase [Bacteroidales bacterium]|nr:alpha/beta hydrolase [Bacteroidales bacterium]